MCVVCEVECLGCGAEECVCFVPHVMPREEWQANQLETTGDQDDRPK
jgi:hypothetical protein